MRNEISSSMAPKPIGPFSQAIETNELVFISGQLPIDATSGFMPNNIEKQTHMCFINLNYICKAANVKLSNATKVEVLLADINDFSLVNEIYAQYFTKPYPTRVAFEVGNLPLGAKVEITAIIAKE